MKKSLIFFMPLLMLLVLSCSKDDPVPVPPGANVATQEGSYFVFDDLIFTISDGDAIVMGVKNNVNTDIKIPSSIAYLDKKEKQYIQFPVVGIYDNCFENNKVIRTVSIPNSVLLIGQSAFSGTDIESISFGNTVKMIDVEASDTADI